MKTVLLRALPLVLSAFLLLGCSGKPRLGEWDGPTRMGQVKVEPWTFQGKPATRVITDHYVIHTTIEDEELILATARVMEGALGQYRKLAPAVSLSRTPMNCYMFARRAEWAEYTKQTTGEDAAVYLQIARGGYAVGDEYVAFFLGDAGTYAVAAHEGWHQYVARHFKGRIPPFLEEGISCMFENINWDGDFPRWNLSINAGRTQALRNAIEDKRLWPLETLVTLHAGQVINLPSDRIEAFYSQSWAFARFLWEGENGKYRPALQRLLADTADGTVEDRSGAHQRAGSPWNGAGVQGLIEHYTATGFDTLNTEYQAFIRKVAYEEFRQQWQL